MPFMRNYGIYTHISSNSAYISSIHAISWYKKGARRLRPDDDLIVEDKLPRSRAHPDHLKMMSLSPSLGSCTLVVCCDEKLKDVNGPCATMLHMTCVRHADGV